MNERKIILYIAMSLDGYIATKDGSIDWLESDEPILEEDNSYETFYETVDTVIMGSTTYDQVVNELSPDIYPYENATSYVLTSKKRTDKENIHFVNQDIVDLVDDLKEKSGKNIWIVGGSSIVAPLVAANLIDEYQLAIVPVILGEGIPLFKAQEKTIFLKKEKVYTKNNLSYLTFVKK
ncbi:dihydrofolate reductase family protein [Vagococcus silagei]|uniref:Dihydrofolate reductase n=1 Tax=Vagococcus silagei TaxID=2508885 RepID=A0A4S3B525_9ENTE|nr:dihydrofolate reductase family protein [Vagococcus silagei]THB61588.1 dihydrofolate reductase [Vagococcus silagei]